MLRRMAAAAAALVCSAILTVIVAPPASASIQKTCFGYTGTFADYRSDDRATEARYSWEIGGDNCLGISPGRQIWITSAGHPWAVVPGDGRADAVSPGFEFSTSTAYYKGFRVWVASSGNYYCQVWGTDQGWDGNWWQCGPPS